MGGERCWVRDDGGWGGEFTGCSREHLKREAAGVAKHASDPAQATTAYLQDVHPLPGAVVGAVELTGEVGSQQQWLVHREGDKSCVPQPGKGWEVIAVLQVQQDSGQLHTHLHRRGARHASGGTHRESSMATSCRSGG